ncbi:MAG: PTS system mannose/fructose/sorbose family transporter subunit IID, partial [Merdibacter sp.]|nr:PTS system mannose/fructose/sorbose family transporter subunit IID [Merdibacter sp.]
DTKEEQAAALETYKAFFNTEPQLGSVIVGVTVGLEEARANNEGVDGDTINGLRAGLMGPIAGIGDSLVVGVLIPLLLGIALGLSTGGSPVGAIFYIVAWNLIITFGMRLLYYKGYELGGKAVEFLTGEKSKALRESIMMLGSMVIGAVAATWVTVKTVFQMTNPETGEVFLNLNDQINSVLPKGLTAIFVIFCWYLIAKKKMSPLKVMLLLVVIAFVGVLIGFFDPQLTY